MEVCLTSVRNAPGLCSDDVSEKSHIRSTILICRSHCVRRKKTNNVPNYALFNVRTYYGRARRAMYDATMYEANEAGAKEKERGSDR